VTNTYTDLAARWHQWSGRGTCGLSPPYTRILPVSVIQALLHAGNILTVL